MTEFDLYIDPSGTVRTPRGMPVPEATVALYRSDNESGPFTPVPDGSAIMSVAQAGGAVTTDLDADLTACRLHLAVQWLAWFVSERPPPWHDHDWLVDAAEAADRLT